MQTLKVVQTELDPATYERLKLLADRQRKPLKVVLREAVQTLVERQEGSLAEDPFLHLALPAKKLRGRNWSERKDWRP